MQLVQRLDGLLLHRIPVNDASAGLSRWASQENVLGSGKCGNKREFLVDRGHTVFPGLDGVVQGDRLTVQQHLACVWLVSAGQTLGQGSFAAPVLAHQGMNLVGYQV